MKIAIKEPRYQAIALEIAKRIVSKELKVGEKLRGRTILSSEYNVSSETIRKAMRLLTNLRVVEVRERSGIYIISADAAEEYINSHLEKTKGKTLYHEIETLFFKQKELQKELYAKFKTFANINGKYEHFPFEYFHINIEDTCPYINKLIGDIPFWQETGGTILAIEHEEQLITSPNPKLILHNEDILYVLGDEDVYKKTLSLLKK